MSPQELRAAAAPAVRNNIMVALADLCVQVRPQETGGKDHTMHPLL